MSKITSNAGLYTHLNETESGGVKYWNSPNDANHKNSHAEVLGIEFFKFPYSSYMSDHVGKYSAIVSSHMNVSQETRKTCQLWVAAIHEAIGGGFTKVIHRFTNENKDEVFTWAAQQLQGELQ